MDLQALNDGINHLDEIKKLEEIIQKLENTRVVGVVLKDDTIINRIQRGAIKDMIIDECKTKIDEHYKAIEEL